MHSGKTELRTPPSPRRQREPRDRELQPQEETRLALALLLLAALVIGWPLAVRSRHDSLGCQGAFPTANSVPGAKPCRRPVSVLDTLRVQRPSANRRSSVDDLCPAVSCPCARQRCAGPPGRRYHPIGHALSQRRRTDFMVPRSELALGRRAARRPGLCYGAPRWPGAFSTPARC